MTWSILCNLFFLYNKKRHGRILFFHTYYLLLYSTRYTFFSIICVSCTYFPLRVNWIHSIHAYHLYLILRRGSAVWRRMKTHRQALTSSAYLWKVLLPFWLVQCEISVTYPQISGCPNWIKYRNGFFNLRHFPIITEIICIENNAQL